MNDIGYGIAWLGFWLFLGMAFVSCALNDATIRSNNSVEVECIKAGGHFKAHNWYETKSCVLPTPVRP